MTTLYIDTEPYVCAWTENLMDAGLIPSGTIWCRSIKEIQPRELRGFKQIHAFNGMSGWAYALRLAGWPDDREVWTGSCPCQPGSVAGKQKGFEDERHLWPAWQRLIRKQRPLVVFGEQVAGWSAWISLVRGDLERMGYAVGAIPVQAASAGADHFRDRYWFVADRTDAGERGRRLQRPGKSSAQNVERASSEFGRCRDSTLAHCDGVGSQVPVGEPGDAGTQRTPTERNSVRGMVDDPSIGWGEGWTESEFRSRGFTASVADIEGRQYIECPDGKWRRLPPPRVRWLAHGVPARIPQLRAIGNGIDVRPAVAFIKAYMQCSS